MLEPCRDSGGPVLSYLRALPPGFRADRDNIAVDVGSLLLEWGLGQLVPLVTRLEVVTPADAIVVRYAAGIAATASESSGSR